MGSTHRTAAENTSEIVGHDIRMPRSYQLCHNSECINYCSEYNLHKWQQNLTIGTKKLSVFRTPESNESESTMPS